MLRPIAAALAVLALAACGHRAAADPQASSQNGATLGAYVLDATPASPPPDGQASAPPAGQAAGQASASACSRGQDAYKVLVFLVSSDTGTSVTTIVADLRSGQTLAQVAGGKSDLVERQANDLVQAWLQFALANGKLTADQANWYRTVAQGVIAGLMAANVASCIPNGG